MNYELITVLLIDDQSIISQAIQRMLATESDIIYHYCSDPTQALKAVKTCQPTVILQDLVMPQMEGLLLVQFLRSKDAPTAHIPLIVLSSKEDPIIKAQAFELGANDYLVKLPDAKELIARIRYHSKAYLNFLKRQEAEALFKAEILRQSAYIEQVSKVTTAASAVEKDAFRPDAIEEVAAGVAKHRRVQEYNLERIEKGYLPLQIGMGIHVGHMMLGMVGEENRMQGDAFSDNVNLTALLEGLTKFYGVSLLISQQTLEHLSRPDQYQIRFLDRAIVKGRNEPLSVYEVLDADTEKNRRLKLETMDDFERGLENYRQGNLEPAKTDFERVLGVNSGDKTAELYLQRVNDLITEGIPANWDGAWRFTEK